MTRLISPDGAQGLALQMAGCFLFSGHRYQAGDWILLWADQRIAVTAGHFDAAWAPRGWSKDSQKSGERLLDAVV